MSVPESHIFGHAKGVVAVLDTSVLVRAWLSAAQVDIPTVCDVTAASTDLGLAPAFVNTSGNGPTRATPLQAWPA